MVHYLNSLDYQDKFCGKISPILLTLLPMCDIIIMGDKVNNQLHELLDELRSYDTEREWFEFKENWFDQTQLGQYISALSNSAAIEGRKNAYFVWGIHNETHDVTGTNWLK